MSDLKLDDFYFEEDSLLKEQMSEIDLSSLTGGKQLRARLIQLIGNTHKLDEVDTIKLGRIVEMVHNATLTHDDVIDNSHTRRNAPSVPAQINNKKSVLLGDYMLARALHELSDFKSPELTKELTLTLKDLVEGEWIQFENTNPFEIGIKTYELLATKKTGSLFRWCFIAPLIAKNDSEDLYTLYCKYGEQLGVIFQMTDDLIDFNKESKKSYGLDLANNNINFVLHHLGQDYPEFKRVFLQADSIESLGAKEMKALELSVEKAKVHIGEKFKQCYHTLELISKKMPHDGAYLQELKQMTELLQERVY